MDHLGVDEVFVGALLDAEANLGLALLDVEEGVRGLPLPGQHAATRIAPLLKQGAQRRNQ